MSQKYQGQGQNPNQGNKQNPARPNPVPGQTPGQRPINQDQGRPAANQNNNSRRDSDRNQH